MGLFSRMGARHEQRVWERLERRLGTTIAPETRIDYLHCTRTTTHFEPTSDGTAYLTRDGMLVVPERGDPRWFDMLDLYDLQLAQGRFINVGIREHDTKAEWSFTLRSNQPELLTTRFFESLMAARGSWLEEAVRLEKERS